MELKKGDLLQLPVSVVSRTDLGRLLREVEALEEFMAQAAIRQPGTAVKLPRTSRLMDETLQVNNINALNDTDRSRLLQFLTEVHSKAPVLHMSFSADPSPLFIQRLMIWLRQEIHPLVILQVGLQPNIGAGCVVRTTNKNFDFSLRQHFKNNRHILVEKLRGAEAKA